GGGGPRRGAPGASVAGSGMAFRLKVAREADVPELARLHVQTFNETHCAGRLDGPSYALRDRQWREAFGTHDRDWFCLVVENDDGEMVGVAKSRPHHGGVAGCQGEVSKSYLLQRGRRPVV